MSRVVTGLCLLAGAILLFLTATRHAEEPPHHRSRRELFFPLMVFPSSTVFQINIAVQTPIPVPNKTLAISLGYQLNFVLPTNATEFRPKRHTSVGDSLLDMYLPLEAVLQEYGFDGGACTLRCICEAAHASFNHEDRELLDEIAHAILTPSEHVPATEFDCYEQDGHMYVAAECLGRSGADCSLAYRYCPESPLDLISKQFSDEV